MVTSTPPIPPGELVEYADQRVILEEVPWSHYEIMLVIRGDSPRPRMTYLDGRLELMSPSKDHERIKARLARLLYVHAEETGIELEGVGSWTLKSPTQRGGEPDECFTLGEPDQRDVPDLAIEVIWTSGGIDKLEIYRGLGVPEVWFWDRGVIQVFVLAGEQYERSKESSLLPDLDLKLLARLTAVPRASDAVRELRASLGRSTPR